MPLKIQRQATRRRLESGVHLLARGSAHASHRGIHRKETARRRPHPGHSLCADATVKTAAPDPARAPAKLKTASTLPRRTAPIQLQSETGVGHRLNEIAKAN